MKSQFIFKLVLFFQSFRANFLNQNQLFHRQTSTYIDDKKFF